MHGVRVTGEGRLAFYGVNHCQDQLHTPQSLSICSTYNHPPTYKDLIHSDKHLNELHEVESSITSKYPHKSRWGGNEQANYDGTQGQMRHLYRPAVVPPRWGQRGAGTNYRGPAVWKRAWGPTMLHMIMPYSVVSSYRSLNTILAQRKECHL